MNQVTDKIELDNRSPDQEMSIPGSGHNHLSRIFSHWDDIEDSGNKARVIGMLPGEGIGNELINICKKILDDISGCSAYEFDIRVGGVIGVPVWQETGHYVSPEVEAFCRDIKISGGAVLCGPGGGRFVYDLRTRLDLFCKLTPLRPMPSLCDVGPLRAEAVRNVDILVVRENMGGLYQGQHQRDEQQGQLVIRHSFEYSSEQVRRILVVGYKLALQRNKRMCVVYKPGGLPGISQLWKEQAEMLCQNSEVELTLLEIDNASFQIVANAQEFDVVVASNMFGDILADGASVLLGSRGLSHSANFSDDGMGVYQTGHGAAYDLKGTDRANPLAQILSLSVMLAEHFGFIELAHMIESAIDEVLLSGWRTADIMAPGCREVGSKRMGELVSDAVCRRLQVS